MEEKRVNVKVEQGSTFTFTRDFLYIASDNASKFHAHIHINRQTVQWKREFWRKTIFLPYFFVQLVLKLWDR